MERGDVSSWLVNNDDHFRGIGGLISLQQPTTKSPFMIQHAARSAAKVHPIMSSCEDKGTRINCCLQLLEWWFETAGERRQPVSWNQRPGVWLTSRLRFTPFNHPPLRFGFRGWERHLIAARARVGCRREGSRGRLSEPLLEALRIGVACLLPSLPRSLRFRRPSIFRGPVNDVVH